ncbi:transglutaminase-like cysteine peptidase [Pseudomonas benzenivorans]|uniref:Transglutaminase-like cysteine peptidase n=1 Tax=Pseudomonas benzenivorans TaxID=556533 RepID=A0ABZ0Q314_9PSED|nr:transglutaminase-like cysteine peptidase [Pseudomonas benzenivorans]WPC07132.1 transglutaminase-like cysteine peptidase [Pseudomonas benzenivorans]
MAWPLAMLLGTYAVSADWDFARIGRLAEQLYGTSRDGRERLGSWQRLLQEQVGATEAEQLEAVNRFFNLRLRFRDDIELWRVSDYWATPVEALHLGAGDCEDFAIAKYFSLRQLGVPSEKLRITYVKAVRLNQAHMVLTYYPHPSATPLVLDNLIDAIEPANRRTDLVPVYAFNAEGLWLPGSGGGKKVGDSKRLSRWQDLLKKMQAEGFP